jgi:hypothetical protein
MRVKKSTRSKKAARVKKSTKPIWKMPTRSAWIIALVVMTVATAAILLARRPSRSASAVIADARPAGIVTTDDEAMRRPAAAPAAESTPTEPTATSGTEAAAPVTITGCLERDQETFRLKDTAGTDVPKSRSWRSGFLKKSTAPIHVVDASNRVKLPNHVGERVVVRGVLVDREMRVRSLQRVADSCTKA